MTTRRAFGAILVFVAAGLAVAATFLSAYSVQVELQGRTFRYEATSWVTERDDFRGALLLGPIEYGEPAVGAALVMALCAGLAFRVPAARVGSLLGAGVLVGVAWSAVAGVRGTIEKLRDLDAPVPFDVEQGDGVTMLIVAAGIGVVSAVLHQELPRRVVSEPVVDADGVVIHQIEGDDSETPPYGFPVIVEPKEPEEPREPKSD
ncbi:hypothetical protein [Lentzea flava]|uniref:Tryptophan-associated transmembrane protein (Trp_oprn_chp) n=1 Tax=Lentzea flava TaxID=103732 RepID=A0ABQ2UXD7_9PSEU|nr:hypothetical protein [Lentzea flava]MCP2202163.1 hypothetical protein [Lentzea flava]GGU57459.1 hypothetical protein GCM10010178_57360 [Lentzea flava]